MCVGGPPVADVGDIAVPDTVHGRQRNGKPFPLVGCDKLIDIDGIKGLRARSIATTVARRFPTSGYTSQKDVSDHGYPSQNTATNGAGIHATHSPLSFLSVVIDVLLHRRAIL